MKTQGRNLNFYGINYGTNPRISHELKKSLKINSLNTFLKLYLII